jgi:hypothetical protein
MLAAVVANALLAAASLGGGLILVRCLPDSLPRAEKLVYAWLGGYGLLSFVLFLAGQYSFRRATIFLVVSAFLILLVFNVRLNRSLFSGESLRLPAGSTCPVLAIAFVLILTFAAGFAAPAGDWSNDAIAYHLLGPKVWVRDALIRPVLDNCHTAFPATSEVVFATLLAIDGPLAPNVSAIWTFSLFLAIIYFFARRCGLSPTHSLWAVALTATMPAIYAGAHSAFVDVIYAAFVLAAIRILFDADSPASFACIGLFSGLAIATKYTGLLAFPIILVCAIVYSRIVAPQSAHRGLSLVNFLIAALFAFLFGAPFYLRNWFLLGSPIYPPTPLLAQFFHARYLPPETISYFHDYIQARGAGLGRHFSDFVLLPFNLTFHTSNFHGAGGIGLAPLAFAPFAFRNLKRDPVIAVLTLFASLFTIVWFLTQQESRFLIPVYALAAIASVVGWQYLQQLPSRATKILCAIIIAISLSYGCLMIAKARVADIHGTVSAAYASARNHAEVPYLDAFDFLNHDPSVRKILILDRSVAPFYSDKPYVKIIGQWGEHPLPNVTSPQQALRALHHLPDLGGITHILDIQSDVAPFQVPQNNPCCTLVFSQQRQRVYRVQ